jgi:pimeloyl-ACP methyl ester carboxylesterase
VTSANTEGRLEQISAPTLILAGAEDILTPMRFSQRLASDIPSNRLEIIEGAGHGMIWSHPDVVVDHVGRFLT